MLGQIRSLCNLDVACEFPQDIDDENITDQSFLSATPGETTRMSSAHAFFRGAIIVADVLDALYPPAPSPDLSVQTIAALNARLDAWYADLAPHLRLKFTQEKPSTAVIGSRAPFLVSPCSCTWYPYLTDNFKESCLSLHSNADLPAPFLSRLQWTSAYCACIVGSVQ